MNILDGWKVTSEPTHSSAGNYYKWTVSNPSADGKIVLESRGFLGGFETCGFLPVSITDLAKTNNPNLTFITYNFVYSNVGTFNTTIVNSTGEYFKAIKDEAAPSVSTTDIRPGLYYFCSAGPAPGMDLGLNKEPSPGYARISNIHTYDSNASNVFMKPTAKSYADIKTMLTSIK